MSPADAPHADLTYRIIGLAMRVHRRLGPGLLESIYTECLRYELTKSSIPFQHQVSIPVHYDNIPLQGLYVADIIVADQVILELKAVEHILPVHEAQLLTYLRLTGCKVGLLINFNTAALTDGIRRRVN